MVVVLSELYPKAKTELIVEISRMEKNQIKIVLSKLFQNFVEIFVDFILLAKLHFESF